MCHCKETVQITSYSSWGCTTVALVRRENCSLSVLLVNSLEKKFYGWKHVTVAAQTHGLSQALPIRREFVFLQKKNFKKSLPSKRCLCFLSFLVIIDHWWQYSACICVESSLKFLVWIADNFIWLWFSASPSSSPYLHIFPLWFYRFLYFIPLSHVFSRLKIHGLLSLLFEWNWFHN